MNWFWNLLEDFLALFAKVSSAPAVTVAKEAGALKQQQLEKDREDELKDVAARARAAVRDDPASVRDDPFNLDRGQ